MILILDACTISNLIHVFQDDTLFKSLPRAFPKIYVCKEVIKEVQDTKEDYRDYYSGKWDTLESLYSSITLQNYMTPEDDDKLECQPILLKYFLHENLPHKHNGEFYSSLLSLYISRLGVKAFSENTNQILFATDDAKADLVYRKFFHCNQIGSIISSIDLVIIMYLKNILTKKKVLSYIEGLYPLYSRDINSFKSMIKRILKKEKEPGFVLGLNTIDEYLSNGDFKDLLATLESASFRKLYRKHYSIKEKIKSINIYSFRDKFDFLKMKHNEFKNELVWKV